MQESPVTEHKITSAEVIDALTSLKRLPSFPRVLEAFDELVAQEGGAHVEEIAKLLQSDPRMMAGVLQVANCAKYRSSGEPITDVNKAVSLLGVADVRLLIMTLSFLGVFQATKVFHVKEFLKYSMVSAYIAQALAPSFKVDSSYAFTIGLFHDVGVYLLATYSEEGIEELITQSMRRPTRLAGMERDIFGVTHQSVGARIVQNWNFPKPVVMGVLGHHAPPRIERDLQNFAYLGLLAEAGAFTLGLSNGVVDGQAGYLSEATQSTLKRILMSEDAFQTIAQQAYESAMQTGLV